MPYIESETNAKIREIINLSEPLFDGINEGLVYYEVSKGHFRWLIEQAEKVEILNAEKELLQAKWEAQGLMIQKLHEENATMQVKGELK